MQWLHAKDLPGFIERQFGAIVSESTLFRLRRRYPLPVPCKEDEVRAWWQAAMQSERDRKIQAARQRSGQASRTKYETPRSASGSGPRPAVTGP